MLGSKTGEGRREPTARGTRPVGKPEAQKTSETPETGSSADVSEGREAKEALKVEEIKEADSAAPTTTEAGGTCGCVVQ